MTTTDDSERYEMARDLSVGIALTGPAWENVPVNSCPDDDPPGQPRPMRAVPVNDLTPLVEHLLTRWTRRRGVTGAEADAHALESVLDGLFRVYVNLGEDTDGARTARDFFGSMADPGAFVAKVAAEYRQQMEAELDAAESHAVELYEQLLQAQAARATAYWHQAEDEIHALQARIDDVLKRGERAS